MATKRKPRKAQREAVGRGPDGRPVRFAGREVRGVSAEERADETRGKKHVLRNRVTGGYYAKGGHEVTDVARAARLTRDEAAAVVARDRSGVGGGRRSFSIDRARTDSLKPSSARSDGTSSAQRAQGGSDYAVLRQRAETASQAAARSGRREDHVAAAQAHVDAHAAARSKADKAHHDSHRGKHARQAYPELYGGKKPAKAAAAPAAEAKPALSVQKGKKGGSFVISASGKKRYLGKKSPRG